MQALDIQHLPQPDPQSRAHSEAVANHIRRKIADAGGSIGFAEFMQHALYAPGLGYYSAGATKFGAAGDFVTAPEISPVFARVLGRHVSAVLQQFDHPDERNLFEPGAGSGKLAADLLLQLKSLDALPQRYFILEVSPELRERQAKAVAQALPDFIDRVVWLDGMPESFSGVVVANEVLDALPAERFLRSENEVLRRTVVCDGECLAWNTERAPTVLRDAVLALEQQLHNRLAAGYSSEMSLAVGPWLKELSAGLGRAFVFLFDYGVSQREYYAEDRGEGWLRCYFRHHAHNDALAYPGIQDLSTWVNFTQVANAAVDAGMDIAGYVTQAQFILHGGLEHELRDFGGLTTAAQLELSNQIKVLTMPGEMGENVKCLAFSKGDLAAPEFMAGIDRAHTL